MNTLSFLNSNTKILLITNLLIKQTAKVEQNKKNIILSKVDYFICEVLLHYEFVNSIVSD